MTGFGRNKARAFLLAGAMLPAIAAAQSNSAAPQQIPNIPFSLPPSATPTPRPTPTSGPVVAPLPTPTPPATVTPAPTPAPAATRAPRSTPTPTATPTSYGADAVAGVVNIVTKKTVTGTVSSPTPTPVASATPARPAPAPTSAVVPAPGGQPSNDTPAEGWIAIGVALAALASAAWFLFRRPRRLRVEAEPPPPRQVVEPVPAPPPPAPEPAAPAGLLTVPLRPRRSETGEPRVEIALYPRRAGTNLTSAAVDYRLVLRNTGSAAVREVRVAMYMLSASAQQAQDLQMIFAAPIEQVMTPPFAIEPGGEVELSGMALLDRDRVNVMTIEGRPWFVPVLAVKADYRWGENVGAPGVATAAHMIGIDRGEGAKMGPFRMDGPSQMHPRVAERKVA